MTLAIGPHRPLQLAGPDVPALRLLLSPGPGLRRIHDLLADRRDDAASIWPSTAWTSSASWPSRPLLLHFFMIFPLRKALPQGAAPRSCLLLYAPAALLLLARIRLHVPLPGRVERGVRPAHPGRPRAPRPPPLRRLRPGHAGHPGPQHPPGSEHPGQEAAPHHRLRPGLRRPAVDGLLRRARSSLGGRPSTGAELTVLLQALIPLVFSYSISRYRLVDIEVFLKKAATLTFSFFVIASVYLFVSSRTRLFSENRLNAVVLGVVAIVLGATLFTPLKRLFQGLLDRAIYKRSYEYRKTLLSITRDLSRERNLGEAGRLAPRGHLQRPEPEASGPPPGRRDRPARPSGSSRPRAKGRRCPAGSGSTTGWPEPSGTGTPWRFVSASESEPARAAWESLADLGFYHILPLKVEDKVIGCLAMGKKPDGSVLLPGGLGAADDDLGLGRPGPGERRPLRPRDRPGHGDAAAQGLQREHHREPDRRRVRRRRGRRRHRLEPRPRGPGHGPQARPPSAASCGTSSARPPTSAVFPQEEPGRSSASQRDRDRGRPAGRKRSSTSPGRRCSTTPSGPTGRSSSSRTSPTRSASSSSC
ncbi:MAG: hypothetical protein MZV64_32750 [Ignavibacteriales bacterium]|nr:hypothetical protein [Ignavibacteriales bacterium]